MHLGALDGIQAAVNGNRTNPSARLLEALSD
jgi:hypothetical protein